MKSHFAMIRLLLHELFANRVIYVSIAITCIFVWYLSLATSISHRDGIIDRITITGVESSIQAWTDTLLFGILLLLILGVSSLAWIFPTTTQKGRIELLHSKPITRRGLIFSMLCASLIGLSICFVLLLSSVAIVWGIRYSFWSYGAVVSIFISVNTAFVILCYYFLFAVMSNNSLLSLALTWVYAVILPVVLQAREKLLYPLFENEFIRSIIDVTYYVVPQISDLTSHISKAFFNDSITLTPFVYSSIFALISLFYTVHIFNNKDY